MKDKLAEILVVFGHPAHTQWILIVGAVLSVGTWMRKLALN